MNPIDGNRWPVIPPGAARAPWRARAAFTLVELLTVLAIIVVLIAIIGPAVNSIVRGPLLTQASDEVVSVFNLAQQTAMARNQSVAVRFYQYADPSVGGEVASNPKTGRYRALQLLFANEDGTVTPFRAVDVFPVGIIADTGTSLSTLLADSQKLDPQGPIPRAGTAYNCREFRFRPDGSTNLSPLSKWFITLHNNINGDGLSTPPPNYVTIQIDPINGVSTVYRP